MVDEVDGSTEETECDPVLSIEVGCVLDEASVCAELLALADDVDDVDWLDLLVLVNDVDSVGVIALVNDVD